MTSKDNLPEKHKTNRKLRLIRFSFWFLLISGILSLILFIFVHFFLTPLVKKKIISTIYETSGGLYSLEIGHFNLQFWKGAVHMTDLNLRQDTIILNQLRKRDPSSNLSNINIKIANVRVSSVGWQNYLFNRSLEVGRVLIENPELNFEGRIPKDTIKISKQSFIDVLPGIIAGFAGSLKIQELTVSDGKLQYNVSDDVGISKQRADSINIHMEEIKIDTISPRKVLYTDHVHFRLKNYELVTSDNLYQLKVKEFSGSYADSLLNIDSIKFIPKQATGKNNDYFSIKIKQIKTTGIDFPLFFRDKKVSLGNAVIVSPEIILKYNLAFQKNDSLNSRNFVEAALPYVGNSFKIKTLKVENGKIDSDISYVNESIQQKASNINLTLLQIKIDTATLRHGHYWKNLTIKLSDYEGKLHSKNLKINIDKIDAATTICDLSGIQISQLHPAGKSQQLFFKNHIKHIAMNGIDFHRLFRHREISINHMRISSMFLEVFRDRSLPSKQSYTAQMPNELVRELSTYLRLKKFVVSNGYIAYIDKSPELKEAAKITFEKTDIEISNLTNDPKAMNEKNPALIKIKTMVMGKGQLTMDLSMNLLSQSLDCSYKGSLSKMDATSFNSFIAYAGIQLKEGNIEAQSFDVKVKNGTASGSMLLTYKDLHVKVIDKKSGKTKKLLSKIANLALKNHNKQEKNKAPETVPVNYQRNPDDGFFSYAWNSINGAILDTIVKGFFEPIINEK